MATPADSAPGTLEGALRLIDISGISRAFRCVSLANYFMLVVCGWGPGCLGAAIIQDQGLSPLVMNLWL